MSNSVRKKIAFVSPRYGLEVNGGAELYCRQLSERLTDNYDIEVLTTCAIDYVSWKDEYKEGTEVINNVFVRRFKVDFPRNMGKFDVFTRKLFEHGHSIEEEIKWMELQGPSSGKLIYYLKEHKDDYAAVLFIPYIYYTTYFGMQIVPDKCILIPAAHDEPFIKLEIFRKIFNMARGIIFLTEEERKFVHVLFQNNKIPNDVIGAGVDIPFDINIDRFRKKYKILNRFMLYIGRIDESKGCRELFEYFIRYKKENTNDLKLVMMGKSVMKIPDHPDIISLGFVSDADKFDGILASEFTVLPSKYESLSISVLESLKLSKPVLVNGNCDVLKGHCIKSNAGLYYMDYNEFEACINTFTNNRNLLLCMGENGKNYMSRNYSWDTLIVKVKELIQRTSCNE